MKSAISLPPRARAADFIRPTIPRSTGVLRAMIDCAVYRTLSSCAAAGRTARFAAQAGAANRAVRAATQGKERASKNRTFSESRGSRPLCPQRHMPAAGAGLPARSRPSTGSGLERLRSRLPPDQVRGRFGGPRKVGEGRPDSRAACRSVQNPSRRFPPIRSGGNRAQSQGPCRALENMRFSNRAISGPRRGVCTQGRHIDGGRAGGGLTCCFSRNRIRI